MGRGRGKGKKLTVVTSNDDTGSGGKEAVPICKRAGRPQNSSNNDIDEDGAEKIGEGVLKLNAPSKEANTVVNGKKRKKHAKKKENSDLVKAQHVGEAEPIKELSTSPNGFRHNGSRRKNKPHRAAEAGFEWK